MAETIELVKKRRCWPRVVLAAVLLITIGSLFAWRLRPLNTFEMAIVGKWTIASPDGPIVQFRPDRRVFMDGREIADWSASQNSLSLKYRVSIRDNPTLKWSDRFWSYLTLLIFPRSFEVTWDGADHFSFGHR